MRSLSLAALAVIASLSAELPGQVELRNPGFERGRDGDEPEGWFIPRGLIDLGFRVERSSEKPREGDACARLRWTSAPPAGRFGNLIQSLDASPFRGRALRLRAAIRVTGDATRAQMWLRVDRPDRQRGAFDNMGDRPVRSATWSEHEIVVDVADDATRITLGLMLFGPGEAFLDTVRLETVAPGAGVWLPEKPRRLTPRGLDNLVAFTRLFGWLRHLHPSDQCAEADWVQQAIAGVLAVESAADGRKLAASLAAWAAPLAPTVHVDLRGRSWRPPAALLPPKGTSDHEVTWWSHRGFGQAGAKSVYRSKRRRKRASEGPLPEGVVRPERPFVGRLLRGVVARVPLTLIANSKGTLPLSGPQAPASLPEGHRATGDDRATRLAAVIIAWNVFEHFYPYFDVVDVDWNATLKTALRRAAEDTDATAFHETLQRLVADLEDGHGAVVSRHDPRGGPIPLLWTWAEDQLVVTVVDEANGLDLRPGDVVSHLDGVPAKKALAEASALISGATPQWIRHRALQDLRRSKAGQPLELTVRASSRGDRPRKVRVRPRNGAPALAEPRPEVIAELEDGIWYVDMDRVTDAGFKKSRAELAAARGIVFDFRGYPADIRPQTFFGHLSDKKLRSAQWHLPRRRAPGEEGLTFDRLAGWLLLPTEPRFTAKCAFIIDGRAISYAESCLGIVEHYELGALVGEATAGTNGNINPFELPGGYRVIWTGLKVLKHDGSQHHGVGIRPTIPVARTRAGIRKGEDELLLRAIEAVR